MDDGGETKEARLPLKPVVFQMLLALWPGASYGWAIMQAVDEQSGGRLRLATGPFYRQLRKLLDEGLVEEVAERPADDDPRRGAYYALTALGRSVVREESARLTELVDLVQRLEGPPVRGRA